MDTKLFTKICWVGETFYSFVAQKSLAIFITSRYISIHCKLIEADSTCLIARINLIIIITFPFHPSGDHCGKVINFCVGNFKSSMPF